MVVSLSSKLVASVCNSVIHDPDFVLDHFDASLRCVDFVSQACLFQVLTRPFQLQERLSASSVERDDAVWRDPRDAMERP